MKLSTYIEQKQSFRIAFIGGSITEGSGASSKEKCMASRITQAVREKYPQKDIVCINAGIGGTTSALGLFRFDEDVLCHKPDMLFIDFAVNDYKLKTCGVYLENIIRKAKAYNSNMPVVLIYATTEEHLGDYRDGSMPFSVSQHIKVAQHYGLPQFNVGYDLFTRSKLSAVEFSKTYLCDRIHPNDLGHRGYADVVTQALWDVEFSEFDPSLPYLFGRDLPGARKLPAVQFADESWKLSHVHSLPHIPDYIYACHPGDKLEFTFDGSILGLYYTVEKDSGILEYSIDGSDWKSIDLWDEYALLFSRAHFLMIEELLPKGEHSVTLKISPRKAEKSEGYYARIGAFCVG